MDKIRIIKPATFTSSFRCAEAAVPKIKPNVLITIPIIDNTFMFNKNLKLYDYC